MQNSDAEQYDSPEDAAAMEAENRVQPSAQQQDLGDGHIEDGHMEVLEEGAEMPEMAEMGALLEK